jgi:hypothetical protein
MDSKGGSKHKIPIFLFLFLVGVGFGAWGMLTPPGGIIDGSVLIFVAQIFVLAASVYGFEVHFDLKEGQFHAGKKEELPNQEDIS